MPIVDLERKKDVTPVRSEIYIIVDSNGDSHPVVFANNKATVSLPEGEAWIVIGFSGNKGSKISLKISSPAGIQNRSASIREGVSIFTARYFKV